MRINFRKQFPKVFFLFLIVLLFTKISYSSNEYLFPLTRNIADKLYCPIDICSNGTGNGTTNNYYNTYINQTNIYNNGTANLSNYPTNENLQDNLSNYYDKPTSDGRYYSSTNPAGFISLNNIPTSNSTCSIGQYLYGIITVNGTVTDYYCADSSGNPFDQSLNTTDNVNFNRLDLTDDISGWNGVNRFFRLTSSDGFGRLQVLAGGGHTSDITPFSGYIDGSPICTVANGLCGSSSSSFSGASDTLVSANECGEENCGTFIEVNENG